MWNASSWRSEDAEGSFLNPSKARILAGEVGFELTDREEDDKAFKDVEMPLTIGEEDGEEEEDSRSDEVAVVVEPDVVVVEFACPAILVAARGDMALGEVGDSVVEVEDWDRWAFLAWSVWMESLMLKNWRLRRMSCCRSKICWGKHTKGFLINGVFILIFLIYPIDACCVYRFCHVQLKFINDN